MGWLYPSSPICAKVAHIISSDAFVKTKSEIFQFGVHKINAEINVCLSFSKASNASGVASEGGYYVSKI